MFQGKKFKCSLIGIELVRIKPLYSIRDAMPADLPKIIMMLDQSDLPTVDREVHLANFVMVETTDEIIGTGGLRGDMSHPFVRRYWLL